MNVSEIMSEKEKNMLEEYFTRGINAQTCAPNYDGEVDLDRLLPFIEEALPIYIKLTKLGVTDNGDLAILCQYKGEPVAIIMDLLR